MRVYHFLNEQFGLNDLKERHLKIARIMELNDPFEFLGADLTSVDYRRVLQETKSELSKSNGLLCFSRNWTNPLLWGHYADKHKGVCLGFDVPDDNLKEVEYVSERFPIPAVIDDLFMKKLLSTKFEHWQYEEEYRTFVSLTDDIDGYYYANFSDNLKLKQVIVGVQSPITKAQIFEALGDLAVGVEAFKVRAAFKSFEVVPQNNPALWV
jgi:hypothetical protein